MSNAINIHGSVQSRSIGFGSALRCVMGVADDLRTRLLHQRPGKRLHPAARLYAASEPLSAPASLSPTASMWNETASWQRSSMPRTVETAAARACTARTAAADLDLPAAVWATLVVVRAASA